MTATLEKPETQELREYAGNAGARLTVDAAAGVIKGVKILGRESANQREYPPQIMRSAMRLYEGARVNVNHGQGVRDYRDRIGITKNIREEGGALYGDLHFNPEHPLAKQLAWDAEHAPQNVGLSHIVKARTVYRGGKTIVEEINQVVSVDLVTDPATTKGLYESTESDMELTLEQVVASPQIMDRLRKTITEEIAAGDAAKQTAAKIDALEKTLTEQKTKLAEYEASEKKAARIAEVEKQLTEAKLPDYLCGDEFKTLLVESNDETAKRLLEDRKKIASAAPQKTGPQARSQHIEESAAPTGDISAKAKGWAQRLKRAG